MSILFIPKKIRVGFQEREGTYTGQLAYVIYYDAKGKLRKEVSWEQWRDKKIEPQEFDNTPQDGFVLNKGIKRYNWSHFGSNRSYIRVYDSRGIEFEITPENLIGLLTETNCSKRGFEGEFVYAWSGKELVLLPCCSEEYGEACKNTERQGKKISLRDLKPGCSYTTKRDEEVIYMGRFMWHSWCLYGGKGRVSKKKHIFAYPGKNSPCFDFKNDASFLAELNSDDPVQNYAEMMDEFKGDIHSCAIEGWETRPLKTSSTFELGGVGWQRGLKRRMYTEKCGDKITFWNLFIALNEIDRDQIDGFKLVADGTLDIKKLEYHHWSSSRSYYYDHDNYHRDTSPVLSRQNVLDRLAGFVEVDAVLSGGKKLHVERIETIAIG